MTINVKGLYHGFDKIEKNKVHCYYMTNKDYGSEFLTTPKTLGLVVSCPVLLDSEVGEYVFRNSLPQGYYCRLLAEESATVEINLRPTSYKVPLFHVGDSVKKNAKDLKVHICIYIYIYIYICIYIYIYMYIYINQEVNYNL
jgi:hypothetical protein